jgi:chemotaxis protein MotA
MDIATIIGLSLGILALVGGALLEGLHLESIMQATAALIVLGGTFGATILSFPMKTNIAAIKAIRKILTEPKQDNASLIKEIVEYAMKSRREGLISMESQLKNVSDEFLRRALQMAVDGADTKTMRETMEVELDRLESEGDLEAKVFEAAGGYAPTIGIIGAVLGLIHVMQNLDDPSKLGSGIAVAFVATVYGIGSANLIFFPFASKLRVRHKQALVAKEMMLQGAIGIQEGTNQRIIEEKLKSYLSIEQRVVKTDEKMVPAPEKEAA